MRKIILLFSVCALTVLALAIGIWVSHHPTHYKFNDRAIIGSTEAELVEKYGAFSKTHRDETGELARGVYMIRDNTPELIMSYDNSLWYEIYFENGIAVNVRLQKGRYGG